MREGYDIEQEANTLTRLFAMCWQRSQKFWAFKRDSQKTTSLIWNSMESMLSFPEQRFPKYMERHIALEWKTEQVKKRLFTSSHNSQFHSTDQLLLNKQQHNILQKIQGGIIPMWHHMSEKR